MKRLLVVGLFLAATLLVLSTQAGAAKPQANKVKQTAHPVWTLAMDWPRVAYAAGKEGNSIAIHVWNVATGKTSLVQGGQHGFATHHTAEVAIAGTRVAWIRAQQFGNTELNHWLYSEQLGGLPHLLKRTLGYTGTDCGLGGPQIGGLVGTGSFLAVSTWEQTGTGGSASANEKLSLITPKGLHTIARGPNAILSGSADGGHVAVLPLPTYSVGPDYCESTPPTSVAVYAADGTLLQTIPLPPPEPSTIGYQVALRGNQLVVLTTGLFEPSGPATVTLSVYDWTTGQLLHTWPVALPQYPGEVNFKVYGHLAAVEGAYRLHLVDLDTGKDVAIAPSSHTVCPVAIGPHGLVYAVNPHNTGKLVFVPMAKLLAKLS